MARLARFIIPGIPHHVTQRGNGRQQTFFSPADYLFYRSLLTTHCAAAGVDLWSWVLMPNHVHMILIPQDADGIRAAMSRVNRAYAGYIHAREKRTGHFWQGRFGCVAMDEAHLAAAIPYIALNPVRARLVKKAADWRWSSVHALLDPATGDGLTTTGPVIERVGDFAALLRSGEDEMLSAALRKAESVGRPLGDSAFFELIEHRCGRDARPGKRGRPIKVK
ncbi:MAG: transposase [Sphingorhabdus sp.]